MPFLKESPRSLSIFFIVSGVLGGLLGLIESAQLRHLDAGQGLNGIGKFLLVSSYLQVGMAVVLIISGFMFTTVARKATLLLPAIMAVAILLRIVVIAVMPSARLSAAIGIAILLYLLVQYRRVASELRQDQPATA